MYYRKTLVSRVTRVFIKSKIYWRILPIRNILFVSLILNQSMSSLSEYNLSDSVPLLNLPEIPNELHLDDNTLDLKKIIYERSSAWLETDYTITVK